MSKKDFYWSLLLASLFCFSCGKLFSMSYLVEDKYSLIFMLYNIVIAVVIIYITIFRLKKDYSNFNGKCHIPFQTSLVFGLITPFLDFLPLIICSGFYIIIMIVTCLYIKNLLTKIEK